MWARLLMAWTRSSSLVFRVTAYGPLDANPLVRDTLATPPTASKRRILPVDGARCESELVMWTDVGREVQTKTV
jgi:hypothetical protein